MGIRAVDQNKEDQQFILDKTMFLALLAVIIGALLVIKSNWLVNTFGYVSFAEGSMRAWGGTRMLWKLIGIGIIIIAFLHISELLDGILLSIFSSTIGGLQQ